MIPLRDSQRSRRFPLVTVTMIIINILVFAYELTLTRPELDRFYTTFGLVPARMGSIPVMLLQGEVAAIMTLLTAAFIHGSWIHIGGNMLYLWVFGDNVEERMGRARFIVFYLVTATLANLAHLLANPASTVPTVGASGAVAGVLGAYLISFPRARVLALIPLGIFFTITEVPAILFLILWFVLQLASGLMSLGVQAVGGVAWWAHIGGFLSGMVLVLVFRRRRTPRYI